MWADRFNHHIIKPADLQHFQTGADKYPMMMWGVISYGTNVDVFGYLPSAKWVWSKGSYSRDRAKAILSDIVRPSEVALFCDAGHELAETMQEEGLPMRVVMEFTTGWAHDIPDRSQAGWLEGVVYDHAYVPMERHGMEGGISISYADGHASFSYGLGWYPPHRIWPITDATGQRVKSVKQYSQRARVTPYNP